MLNAAIASVARDLARCRHREEEQAIPGGDSSWCRRCGALRLGVGGWFRPAGAHDLGRLLGPELSERAARLYAHVFDEGPFACTLSELVGCFGMAPVLELVQADCLTLDECERVCAVRAVGQERPDDGEAERASDVLLRSAAP
jgi:hypothetical protein